MTEAAQLIGVSAGTIRMWETHGLVRPSRDQAGRRRYVEADIVRLRKIAWWRRVRSLNAAAIRQMLESEEYTSLATQEPARPKETTIPSGRLRAMRRQAGLTLKQVSEQSGLSVSFISAVERGVSGLSPTAEARLLAALGGDGQVSFENNATVHRLGDGPRVDIAPGITYEWLSNYKGLMDPQLALIQSGARSEGTYQHDGEEIILVLSGSLELNLDGAVHELATRESVHFSSQLPHSWANNGADEAEVLWITTERGVWTAGATAHGSSRKDGTKNAT